MEYTLYLKPQFTESKKSKQDRGKSRKNDFVETQLLNLLKSCVLLPQFLKIFLFSFVFYCITKLQAEIQARKTTSRCEGIEAFSTIVVQMYSNTVVVQILLPGNKASDIRVRNIVTMRECDCTYHIFKRTFAEEVK